MTSFTSVSEELDLSIVLRFCKKNMLKEFWNVQRFPWKFYSPGGTLYNINITGTVVVESGSEQKTIWTLSKQSSITKL